MSILRYDAALQALVFSKGHPFARDAFFDALESIQDVAITAVEQPAAETFFDVDRAARFDALVFYDMPGVEFAPGGAKLHAPPAAVVSGLQALLDAGKGLVFLHHAIAGWPTWDAYAEVMGARFFYEQARLRGRDWPDSGYRLAVRHRVSVVAPEHPVVAGVEDGFEIEDELYLCPVFEDDVVPLLRSDAAFEEREFFSASLAIRGKMFSREGWSHPAGSNLVGWARRQGRSPIVTLLLGDGPSAYEHPAFRRLVGNAIRWVASDAAREWAAGATQTR